MFNMTIHMNAGHNDLTVSSEKGEITFDRSAMPKLALGELHRQVRDAWLSDYTPRRKRRRRSRKREVGLISTPG